MGGLLKRTGSGPEDDKALTEQEHHRRQQHPKLIVRGITYYKSDPVDETDAEENSKYIYSVHYVFKIIGLVL